MKKCDCYNQHDKEIRDTLETLKDLVVTTRTRLSSIEKRIIEEQCESNPLIGILAGACIIAALVSIYIIINKFI